MSLFKLFKKKEPEEEITLPVNEEQELDIRSNSGSDKEDLILSKLETINERLENIEERLKKIEEIASS